MWPSVTFPGETGINTYLFQIGAGAVDQSASPQSDSEPAFRVWLENCYRNWGDPRAAVPPKSNPSMGGGFPRAAEWESSSVSFHRLYLLVPPRTQRLCAVGAELQLGGKGGMAGPQGGWSDPSLSLL